MNEGQMQHIVPSPIEALRSLCNAIAGLRCSAWRKGYGYTGSLHFGRMHLIEQRHPGTVDMDQGEVMLNLWDCDRVLFSPDGGVSLDSRVHREEESLAAFRALEGTQVSKVEFDETELSLRLAFAGGHRVALLVDPAQTEEDDEQWAVEAGNGPSVGVFGLAWVRWTDGRDSE